MSSSHNHLVSWLWLRVVSWSLSGVPAFSSFYLYIRMLSLSPTSHYLFPACNVFSYYHFLILLHSLTVTFLLHYMRDHRCCLTPILQGRRFFLEMWQLDFLVIRLCYVSRSKTLKSWILKKSNGWVLSTAIKRTHSTRAGITRILQGIEFFVVKYWYWVKSEANLPKRLGILRALICLVSF